VKSNAIVDLKQAMTKPARGHVTEHVFQQLRHGLMVGAFAPGQVLSLRNLASAFGTSSMPLRAALTRLVEVNALEATEGGSARVPRLTTKNLEELFELRQMLEGRATELACSHANPALIKSLEAINKELLKAIVSRDIPNSLRLNQKFHFTLYTAADTAILLPLIESLWLRVGPTMYLSFLSTNTPWDTSGHVDILEGLREGNAAKVKRAVTREIRDTCITLAPVMMQNTHGLLSSQLQNLHF
jgi:DNA-binding GntR family transcriptional regulator